MNQRRWSNQSSLWNKSSGKGSTTCLWYCRHAWSNIVHAPAMLLEPIDISYTAIVKLHGRSLDSKDFDLRHVLWQRIHYSGFKPWNVGNKIPQIMFDLFRGISRYKALVSLNQLVRHSVVTRSRHESVRFRPGSKVLVSIANVQFLSSWNVPCRIALAIVIGGERPGTCISKPMQTGIVQPCCRRLYIDERFDAVGNGTNTRTRSRYCATASFLIHSIEGGHFPSVLRYGSRRNASNTCVSVTTTNTVRYSRQPRDVLLTSLHSQ